MRRVLFALLIALLAIAQASLFPRLNPISISPDLVLVLIFVWSVSHRLRENLIWVFVVGILIDVLSVDPFGTNALALLPVVLLARPSRRPIFQSNVIVPMALIFVATLAHGGILVLLRQSSFTWFLVFQAVAHIVLIAVIYPLAQRRR